MQQVSQNKAFSNGLKQDSAPAPYLCTLPHNIDLLLKGVLLPLGSILLLSGERQQPLHFVERHNAKLVFLRDLHDGHLLPVLVQLTQDS